MSEYYDPYDDDTPEQPVEPSPKAQQPPKAPVAPVAPKTPKATKTTKEPKKAKEAKTPKIPKTPAIAVDSRVKFFVGALIMIATTYTFVALLSTFFTATADQITISYDPLGRIIEYGIPIANSAGPFGAWLGQTLLTGFLGVGSFVLIFWLSAIGLRLFDLVHFRFWPLTFKCLATAISVSIILGLTTIGSPSVIRLGGHHGYYVNRLLIDYASEIGAICVSILLTVLLAMLYTTPLRRAWSKVKSLRPVKPATAPEDDGPAGTSESPEAVATPEEPETPEVFESIEALVRQNPTEPAEPTEPTEPTEPADDFIVEAREIEVAESVQTDSYDPTATLSHFHLPTLDLLEDRQGSSVTVDTEEQEANKQRIIEALAQFGIQISSIKATVGPTITLFEVVPAQGQRIAAIKRVEEDLALALKALGIRIIAPIPGKGTIGIEVPNNDPQVVSMRSIIGSKKFQECRYELPMALGATISNDVFIADLAKMPHLLVAGATGQGKSVGLNAIITSLLYKKHPAELKFVLVDPKMVEFSLYRELERHYLAKLPDEESAVITDPAKVVATLNSLCVLMDRRYDLLSQAACRGVKEYNQKFIARRLNPEKGHDYMPYIVVIVDEFADLIMTAGKEVEAPICRLAQKARAVGIHVIIATQRPSTNVITGLIKANFPGRIAFRVAQMIDSKTILDRSGAHQLVGKGDMFFSNNGTMERVQCAFVDTPEVEAICKCISDQVGYPNAYPLPDFDPNAIDSSGDFLAGGNGGFSGDHDSMAEECAHFFATQDSASTSILQRRFGIGYNRAGRIMDQLEKLGVVGPANGSKPRAVLMDPIAVDQLFAK